MAVTIGVPAEIKLSERRVALSPSGARELADRGHRVLVEERAGTGAGFTDEEFEAAGALITDAESVFGQSDLIVKVKEPQPEEVPRINSKQTLFTYLHLAAEPELADGLAGTGATCVAYETVEDASGGLPLLAPMSMVAGRLAAQSGAVALGSDSGGRGLLLGGVPGVPPAEVLVLGGGVVGTQAALVALGMGARVTILDSSVGRLAELDAMFGGSVRTVHSNGMVIEELLPSADLVVGAVLVRGERAPWLVRRDHLSLMKTGSVLVDVSIDQGGCFETSKPTSLTDPTYTVDGVVHYCVTNMPGSVPATSTRALTNATIAYVVRLAEMGAQRAFHEDPGFAHGLNVEAGRIVHPAVARALAGNAA